MVLCAIRTDAEVEAGAKEGCGNAHTHNGAQVVTRDNLAVQRTRALQQHCKIKSTLHNVPPKGLRVMPRFINCTVPSPTS